MGWSDDGAVLVTGSASGIGRKTALRLADRGWTVYATDVDADRVATLSDRCETMPLDVTDPDERTAAVERVVEETGGIDVLLNNAGYAVPGTVEDVPVEDARAEFDVLVHGPHALMREALPHMREQGRGRIVTVTSVLGRASFPGAGVYCSAKFAMEGLMDALRMELPPGIEATMVEPAWVDTEFAQSASERLAGYDRSPGYERVYDLYDKDVLSGGPFAVTADRVARTITKAVEADSPRARYPVGLAAWGLSATRHLPDRVQDWLRWTVGGWLARQSD